jgi:hypothetical protein
MLFSSELPPLLLYAQMINVFGAVCKTKHAQRAKNGTQTGSCARPDKKTADHCPRFSGISLKALRSANARFTGFFPTGIETRGAPFAPCAGY